MREFDVAIVGDFRFPGGTSTCIAQEIAAQARAGYKTALVPIWCDERGLLRGFHTEIVRCLNLGLAELIAPGEKVRARFAAFHHPNAFADLDILPELGFDRALLIAHQLPADGSRVEPYYDEKSVAANITAKYNQVVRWAPVGPLARQRFAQAFPHIPLTDTDWVNIIDVDEWALPKKTSGKPVVGRHGRSTPQKWPATKEIIAQAYPASEKYKVRILGGASIPEALLGSIPKNWDVAAYNSLHPKDFLATIDYFVYFHHPEWVEAFGRTILEALASATVTILPSHFEPLFGDSCLYAEPAEVTAVIDHLHADPQAYAAQARKGQQFVREHFGYARHMQRLDGLMGPPSCPPPKPAPSYKSVSGDGPLSPRGRAMSHPATKYLEQSYQRIVFLLVNHTTDTFLRDLREIESLQMQSGGFVPIVITDFPEIHEVNKFGYACEYLASASDLLSRDTKASQQIFTYDGSHDAGKTVATRSIIARQVIASLPAQQRSNVERIRASRWYSPLPRNRLNRASFHYLNRRIQTVGWLATFRRPLAKLKHRAAAFAQKSFGL